MKRIRLEYKIWYDTYAAIIFDFLTVFVQSYTCLEDYTRERERERVSCVSIGCLYFFSQRNIFKSAS